MLADVPDVAGSADRRPCGGLDEPVCRVPAGVRILERLGDEDIDLRRLEAGDGNVQIDVELGQIMQLKAQQPLVPAGVLRKLVVGNDIGADFPPRSYRRAGPSGRGRGRSAGRGQAAVACDHAVVLVDQDWIGKAEPADGLGDLLDLLLECVRALVGRGVSLSVCW